MKFGFLFFILLFNVTLSHAGSEQSEAWFSQDSPAGLTLNVDLFITSTCPHCHKADAFFSELSQKTPWLKVHRNVINEDKSKLQLFYQKLTLFHSTDFSVPTIMFCGSRWVGFESSETTGKGLLRALNYCHHQIEKEGQLTQVTRDTLRQWSATSKININVNMDNSPTPLERVFITAMLEAISPCSLFCLLLLLSFLWLHPGHRIARFFSGLVFILMLGVVHSVQFIFTETYQEGLLYLMWFSWLAGGMILLYVVQYAKSQWLIGNERSFVWILPVIATSVVAVYAHQQTCDFSMGALFQQWLQTQTLTHAAYYFYQLTYLGFYLSPLVLILTLYLVFDVHPRRVLPAAALLMLVVIGMLLLVFPTSLASLSLSYCVIVVSLVAGWQFVRV